MIMSREWAMPNHNTFSIKPIAAFVKRHIRPGAWIDPFARDSEFNKLCVATNDLNPTSATTHHIEALDFIDLFPDGCLHGALFDPPYSPRQIAECYKQIGREVHMKDTQTGFYGDRKNALALKIMRGGKVLSFGWNSNGMGKKNGFEIIELMVVAHGSAHNDTICTAEIKC